MTSQAAIHVLTLTPFYPSRDDERGGFIAEPLGEFGALGLRFSVIAVRPLHKNRVLPSVTAPPASWIRYPTFPGNRGLASAGRLLFWRMRSLVRQVHKEHHIDILHAHAPLPCGEAARLLSRDLNIPFAVTVHGLDAYLTEQVAGRAGQRCAELCRRIYQQAGRIVCISEQVRQRVLAQLPHLENTEVVYNGVDPALFFPPENLPEGDPIIASVGSLISIKGHDRTLRALAKLSGEFPTLRCRIIGEGAELGRLQDLTRQLNISGRVEFLGHQTRLQVAQVLRGSSIFALPSHYEGLGCAYLEAMASGLPAIACRGQGIQEVIRHAENGFLLTEQAAERTVHELADTLRILLKNPELRRRIGAAARQTVVERYTLRHQAQGLLRAYLPICRGSLA